MTKQSASFFTSFNYFETLFENTKQNTVLLMDDEGTIIEVNAAFINFFGYDREDIIGKNFALLFTEEDQKKDLPQREIHTVLKKGQAFDNNYLVNKDKTITWVSGESILVKNDKGKASILKIIQNIHKQKESEASILRLNDFNESILKSIENVVIVLDRQMQIIKTNQAFFKLFKHEKVDVFALNFANFIKPYDENNQLYNSVHDTIMTKNGFSNKYIEIETINEGMRIFEVNCSSMKHEDDPNHVLIVLHDITEQKKAEREREDIIGFVAHELRNPLANIVLCNEMMGELANDNNLDAIHSFLVRSKNNVMRLNKMIAELYDVTKVNSGNFVLEISEFNFIDMIKEAIDTIEVLQPDYNIIINGDGNIFVKGDRYRLIQVVTNYLSNGIKYSNGNTDVILTVQQQQDAITVSVKDEGLGISPNHLPYIFERFFRAEKTKNLEGIGLGLYLCRQIISAHNGKVWAESEEGKGSVFYFSIPV